MTGFDQLGRSSLGLPAEGSVAQNGLNPGMRQAFSTFSGVLRLGLVQDGDVEVGVFPLVKEVLITRPVRDDVGLKGVRCPSCPKLTNCLVARCNQTATGTAHRGRRFLGAGVADKDRSAIWGKAAPVEVPTQVLQADGLLGCRFSDLEPTVGLVVPKDAIEVEILAVARPVGKTYRVETSQPVGPLLRNKAASLLGRKSAEVRKKKWGRKA